MRHIKNLKFLIGTLLLSAVALVARAQYDYPEFGFGASYGTNKPYSDLKQNNTDNTYSLALYYNYSPYLPFAFQLQTGKLSGGNNETDASHRYFENNYLAFNLHGDLQLGDIIDYEDSFLMRRLKGLYFGAGLGAIFNHITSIRRMALDDPTYIYPGKNNSLNACIPVRFGYEFKIFAYDIPYAGIFINYTHNFTFAEGLDGYDDPSNHFKNNSQDMFRSITVGIKINFGNVATYIKPTH